MANKLTLALLAVFAAVLLVADASIVRTTVTTTEMEDDEVDNKWGRESTHGQSSQQRCQQEIKGKQFNSCQRYLTKFSRPYDILEVVDDEVNPSQRSLQECCEELQELENPQCSCEALKKVIRQERQQGSRFEGQQGQMRQILQKARSIPQQCDLEVRSCQISEY